MKLVETIKAILLNVSSTTDEEAISLLKNMAGRGKDQYGSKLRNWLESNSEAFPEIVEVENVDHVRDAGVDVILTGQTSKIRVGFQIKSDNDLAHPEFTRELKAQITDSKAWGLSLYVIILACQPTQKNQQKYLHIVNEVKRSVNDEVLIITPPRAAGLLKAFDTPLQSPVISRSWADFFNTLNQPNLISRYIDDWAGILPDERFKPPANFDEIYEAVTNQPLTIIVGPPAVGNIVHYKYFGALIIRIRILGG